MNWLNGLKKGFRYVLLALCFMALVFQPVTCFAANYTYNNYQTFIFAANSSLGYSASINPENIANQSVFVNLVNAALAHQSSEFGDLLNGITSYTALINAPYSHFEYLGVYPVLGYILSASSANCIIYLTDGIPNLVPAQNGTDYYKFTYVYSTRANYNFNNGIITYFDTDSDSDLVITPFTDSIGRGFIGGISVNGNNIYFDPNYIDPSTIPPSYDNTTGNTSNTSTSNVNWNNFSDSLANWLFYNYRFDMGNVSYNIGWKGVGFTLTYLFECLNNPYSNQVTIDNTEYTNGFKELFDSINVDLSTLNANSSEIAESINNIDSIISSAFPEDQAEMNDSIADQILDDSNDTGLTVNRITSAKSDLDDGLNTFKLDTSESQYSNPFSALGDADWSFWSQTTVNNLGSGYSFSFSEGSLMSEDDIFTENQNSLLNLLGW